MSAKPNILLITTDTQRCDTLKCMGNRNAISPNIDRLASQGIMFTQAHTSSPVCFPARCSLMTGLHTPIHGAWENGMTRITHVPTLPDLLKEAGYTNIMVGKTHFNPMPDSFDYVLGDDYDHYLQEHGLPPFNKRQMPTPIPEEHFRDTYYVNQTIAQIDHTIQNNDGPFFAFCSLPAPHPPETPPGDWINAYNSDPVPELNYSEGEEQNQPQQTKDLLGIDRTENECRPGESKTNPDYWREAIGRIIETDHLDTIHEVRRLYYCYAAYCDTLVGRLMDYLDQNGLRENTLILFTSDHGQQYFDHGFNDKHNYYDESWRIPFILSQPSTLPQGETRDFAIWNDIPTTLLGAAGIDCPTMQGFDLYSSLRNNEPSPRKCAVASLYKSCAIATHRWKLEYFFENDEGRLFDRVNDPKEQSDLYHHPDYESVRNDLRHALLSWRGDLADLTTVIDGTKAKHDPTSGEYLNVAPRIAPHTRAMRGTDAEQRLNQKAEAIDLHSKPNT